MPIKCKITEDMNNIYKVLPNTYFSNTTKRMYYYDKQEAAFPLQSNSSVSHSRFESQPEFESMCCKIRLEESLV